VGNIGGNVAHGTGDGEDPPPPGQMETGVTPAGRSPRVAHDSVSATATIMRQ
jgi:hypothetical protein